MLNTNLTFQPKAYLGSLLIFNEKLDSASQKPVIKLGLRLFVLVVYFVLFIYSINMHKLKGPHINTANT